MYVCLGWILQKSLEDKADKLLSILEEKATGNGRHPEVIEKFVECLKEKYKWLYQSLTEDVTDSRVGVLPLLPIENLSGDERRTVGRHFSNGVIKEDKVFESLDERKAKAILEIGGVPISPGTYVERLEVVRISNSTFYA